MSANSETQTANLFERYRPRKLEDIVGNQGIIRQLQWMVRTGDVPQAMVFFGGPGLGKTSAAHAFIKEYVTERLKEAGHADEPNSLALRSALYEVEPMEMRSNPATTLAGGVTSFLRSAGLFNGTGKKFVLFDDIDTFDSRSQHTMLRKIELFGAGNCIILVHNDVRKLIAAVLSRASEATFEFFPVSAAEMVPFLLRVAQETGMQFSSPESVCTSVAKESKGSVRDALGFLKRDWRSQDMAR